MSFEPREYENFTANGDPSKSWVDAGTMNGLEGRIKDAFEEVEEAIADAGSGLDADTEAALAGTDGTPSGANKFVTNSDGRLTDSRAPTAHSHEQSDVTGLGDALGAKADTSALADKADASDLSDHESATEAVHGIADTSDLVVDDDSRLTDQRTPLDGSVTAAKVNAALKPSGSATGTTESLRRLGTGATHAAAGNDSRFPTAGQKSALAGTQGTPGNTNRYVTDGDSRLSDARTPTAHDHVAGDIETSGASDGDVLTVDSGAAVWAAPSGGGGEPITGDDLNWLSPSGQNYHIPLENVSGGGFDRIPLGVEGRVLTSNGNAIPTFQQPGSGFSSVTTSTTVDQPFRLHRYSHESTPRDFTIGNGALSANGYRVSFMRAGEAVTRLVASGSVQINGEAQPTIELEKGYLYHLTRFASNQYFMTREEPVTI